MTKLILTIDLGTSSCKSTLFTLRGEELARATAPYETYYPATDQAEQSPEEWWEAVISSVGQLHQRIDDIAGRLAIIGVTGQMHGLVCVDAWGQPLRPCMTLNDRRSVAEARTLSRDWEGGAKIYAISGEWLDASLPIAKLLWLQRHEAKLFSQTRYFLACKDYVRLCLTGQAATDPLDAAATGLADVRTAQWSSELVDAAGVDLDRLPPVLPAETVAGALLAEPAQALGLRAGTPVAVGAGDDIELVGAGLLSPGIAYEHLGSTGSLLMCTDRVQMNWAAGLELYPYLVPGCWVLGGSTSSAGSALRWATRIFTELDEPGQVPEGTRNGEPLLFLPYLAGERSPTWAPGLRGAFAGLNMGHKRADMLRAVYEGVAFSLRHLLDTLASVGVRPTEVRVAAGTVDDRGWAAMRASIYRLPLIVLRQADPTALGTMIVAAVAGGIYSCIRDGMQELVTDGEVILPEEQLSDRYDSLYRLYRQVGEYALALSESMASAHPQENT